MNRKLKRVLVGIVSAVGLVVLALGVTVAVRQNRKFDAPYPAIHATEDPKVVERGRYLVFGPAHCADCHGAPGASRENGRAVPLSGGHEFHLPVGVFRVPNITPDRLTGIGRYTDPEIARMLRHGVRPDGRAMMPFMPFANLSNDDLRAVISFLRTQKPVRHEVAPHSPNLLGSVVKAFAITPRGPSAPVRDHVEPEATPEYGQYLARSVANCAGCHTKIDMKTGEFAGPLFGGGAEIPSHEDPTKTFITPNLTPDPKWGWINGWSEEAFVRRLRSGPVHAGTPMPWKAFTNLTENDARAIYRYLRSLPAAQTGPNPKDRMEVVRVAER